jgi:hypothetical protein
MKDWVIELYKRYAAGYPFKDLRACLHAAGGSTIEYEEAEDYPEFPYLFAEGRYHSIQYMIDNEHTLAKIRVVRRKVWK